MNATEKSDLQLPGERAGGLVGFAYNLCNIVNSFSRGDISAQNHIGGLIGRHEDRNVIQYCYSTGAPSGPGLDKGGFIGSYSFGTNVSNCFWDRNLSGIDDEAGTNLGVSKTTSDMKKEETYTSWNFDEIWQIKPDETYPWLRSNDARPIAYSVPDSTIEASSVDIDLYAYDSCGTTLDSFHVTTPPQNGTVEFNGSTLTYTPDPDFAGEGIVFNIVGVDDEGLYSNEISVKLTIKATYDEGSGTFQDPYQITTLKQLSGIRFEPSKHFILMNDLDFDGSVYDSTNSPNNAGWLPVDDFTGSLNGNGHTLHNLYINRAATYTVGLFTKVTRGIIRNLTLLDCRVTGEGYAGGLAGELSELTEVSNCYVSGKVTGLEASAGLLAAKGLYDVMITNCASSGLVRGSTNAGGIIGTCGLGSSIDNSYSTAAVYGNRSGGLVGSLESASVSSSFSCGYVSKSSNAGGIAGSVNQEAVVRNCYYDSLNLFFSSDVAGTGKTTGEMKEQATYTKWAFSTVWEIQEGISYPGLIMFNDAPVCTNIKDTTFRGTSLEIELKASDVEDGELNTVELLSQPSSGSVTLDGMTATFTPGEDSYSWFSFTYAATDSEGL